MHKDGPNTTNLSLLEDLPAMTLSYWNHLIICVMHKVASVHELFVTLP